MKVSELRIGNWVTINNEKSWSQMKGIPVRVIGFEDRNNPDFPKSKGAVRLEDNERSAYSQFDQFVEPIPLTEEWLVKFGFHGVYLSDYELETNKGKICRTEGQFYVYSGLGTEQDYGFSANIEYVHQLQNLFYALTGTELTI